MSEQLSLGGLIPPTDSNESQKDEKAVTPKKRASKKSATKTGATAQSSASTSAKPTIDERINALLEAKSAKSGEVAVTTEAVPKIITPVVPVEVLPNAQKLIDIEVVEELEVEVARKAEPEVLTVSSLNKSIKGLLEKNFPFLWVKGEISNCKIPGSGHIYFTLKDSTSQIRAVMFRGFAQSLKFKPEDGMEVLVRCKVTAYEPRGDYQLFCELMEPVGYGALQIAFEKLKAKLQSEGLFDQERKRPLPALPRRIGIVTSPTGAAIRDMINVLSRRMGTGLDITIIPASVQGDKAPGEIVNAINVANRLGAERFDVLIVGRGGGSLEDLWAFNEEIVARAVAASKIPTISAVGHEVDFTICDFVADLRAPTPSAAAELVVKNKQDLIDRIQLLSRQLTQQMQKHLHVARVQAEGFAKRLIDPKRKLQDLMLRCDEWTDRLIQSIGRYIQDNATSVKFLREKLGTPERRLELEAQKLSNMEQRLRVSVVAGLTAKQNDFAKLSSLLNGLSPLAVLSRGFSIVKKGNEVIKDSAQVSRDDIVTITLQQGEISSRIL